MSTPKPISQLAQNNSKFIGNGKYIPTWLRFLIVVMLLWGIFFRFANLDKKVYWHDEVFTSLAIGGYRWEEVDQKLFQNREIGVEDVLKYQRLDPNRTVVDTIQRLAEQEPQHPPLYYVIVRFWVQFFGSSVVSMRGISALLSLLVFPCAYWLCLELFESSMLGAIAIPTASFATTLIAVSPFHIVYAKEAREYGLWIATIFLSSATLLRAMRLKTKMSWIIYSLTVILGLYNFPLIGLTSIAHGFYVIAMERWRWTKNVTACLIANLAAMIAFAPWLWVMLTWLRSPNQDSGWLSEPMSLFDLIKSWSANISRIFFDINLDTNSPLIYAAPPVLMVLLLVGYALYFVCRNSDKRVYLFILITIGVQALPFILPDLILGGRRSSISRYLIPCYLGIQLAVAYLLATKVMAVRSIEQKFWRIVTILVISAGVISGVVSLQADSWWIKKNSHNHPEAARIINQANKPLFLTSNFRTNMGEVISFSHLLEPKVRLFLVREPNIPKIPHQFSDVFVFNPSPNLRTQLEQKQNYKFKPAYPPDRLWRLEKN